MEARFNTDHLDLSLPFSVLYAITGIFSRWEHTTAGSGQQIPVPTQAVGALLHGKAQAQQWRAGPPSLCDRKKRAPHIAGLTKYDFESHNTRLVLQCLSMKLWSFRRTILLLSCICLTNSRFCCPQNHLNVTQEASLGKSFGKVSTFDRNGQDCACRK